MRRIAPRRGPWSGGWPPLRKRPPGRTRDELRSLLAEAEQYGSKRSLALLTLLAYTGGSMRR